MISYNNFDKSNIIKLFIIIKILQQSYCKDNVNKTFKKNSTNINHKKNVISNDLNASSVKEKAKDSMNAGCILPIQEVYIVDDTKCVPPIQEVTIVGDTKCIPPIQEVTIVDDTKCIPLIQEVTIVDDTKCIPSIQEVTIVDDTKCIKKIIKSKDGINDNNITANGIYEIPENINKNHNENFISTLSIIITEKKVDIPIESTLNLKNDTLDKKDMKNHIYLTSSKVLPMYENYDISPAP